MKELSNLDKLFIRACKSTNPQTRLRSIYRRFYYSDPIQADAVIANNLTKIVEDYDLSTLQIILTNMNPINDLRYSGDSPDVYSNRVMSVMWQVIRYSHRDKFPDIGLDKKFNITH